MPDARLQRTRDAYADRQVGIADRFIRCFDAEAAKYPTVAAWRAMHENAAEQLKRGQTANVIEGEQHS